MLLLKGGAVVPRRPADHADRQPAIPAVAHNCVIGAARSLKAVLPDPPVFGRGLAVPCHSGARCAISLGPAPGAQFRPIARDDGCVGPLVW